MQAFESMCIKMQPLKSYNLEEGTNVYNEICAYGVALDKFRELLDEFLRECFICTSKSYGLENREVLVGKIRNDLSLEARRSMLITRNLLGENDFTNEGFGKFMHSFGVTDYQIDEFSNQQKITVQVAGDHSEAEQLWIENQIKMMLPAHLDGTVTFQNMSWSEIDEENITFADMDSKNYSWKYINNLT